MRRDTTATHLRVMRWGNRVMILPSLSSATPAKALRKGVGKHAQVRGSESGSQQIRVLPSNKRTNTLRPTNYLPRRVKSELLGAAKTPRA